MASPDRSRDRSRGMKSYEAKKGHKAAVTPEEVKARGEAALRKAKGAERKPDAVGQFMALRERQRHTEEQMKKLDKLKTKSSDAEREKLDVVHKRIGEEMKELGDHKQLAEQADRREAEARKQEEEIRVEAESLESELKQKREGMGAAAKAKREALEKDLTEAEAEAELPLADWKFRKDEPAAEPEIAVDDADISESKDVETTQREETEIREAEVAKEEAIFGETLADVVDHMQAAGKREEWKKADWQRYNKAIETYQDLGEYGLDRERMAEVKERLGFSMKEFFAAPLSIEKKKLKKGEQAPLSRLDMIKRLEQTQKDLIEFPKRHRESREEITMEEALKSEKERKARPGYDERMEEIRKQRGSLSTGRREISPTKAEAAAERTKLGPEYAQRIEEAKKRTLEHRKKLEEKRGGGSAKKEPVAERRHGPPEITAEMQEDLMVVKGREIPSVKESKDIKTIQRKYVQVGPKRLGFIWKEFQTAPEKTKPAKKGFFGGIANFLRGEQGPSKEEMSKKIDEEYAKMVKDGEIE